MKLTLKLFLVFALATSTIFAEGNMNNGGYSDDGNTNNGGQTCTVNCPPPLPTAQRTDETNTQIPDENDDDSILTIIDDYLTSLFG